LDSKYGRALPEHAKTVTTDTAVFFRHYEVFFLSTVSIYRIYSVR